MAREKTATAYRTAGDTYDVLYSDGVDMDRSVTGLYVESLAPEYRIELDNGAFGADAPAWAERVRARQIR